MRAVADTGPLFAAMRNGERAHRMAAHVVAGLGRGLVVLDVVAVELDYFLRARVGTLAARTFARALVSGEHRFASLSPALLRRAVEIDGIFAGLNLGLVDASIMAYAERHELPILTFDFKHFRAAAPGGRPWQLVVNEDQLARAAG